ncbi:conserved hypothetical protein [Neospora caninum Liverpool]|uniref:Uncharacterized protein n=1 Tax=Neospora caninum (strain Liverpool) TaxID=572307 RepID=F0VKI6_NEOCL|nr:conserved hypothetical protein [Neospora caninum Liverpool]CBZ54587.1 conserved hypothetical protein [Neospora caninum Liverpool]CEL69301.1 TPA: hypothetical protein BN1204_050150 [Neospora caninum Liverpool]|eukprot:XP_003884617.1 conserved hypothetical protein [Neospora caninum Liverpool]
MQTPLGLVLSNTDCVSFGRTSKAALCVSPLPASVLSSAETGWSQHYGHLHSTGAALWCCKERQIERQADVRRVLYHLRSRIQSTQRSERSSRSSTGRATQHTCHLPDAVFSPQRFISLHNIAVRYWDDGRPRLALRHARLALDMLKTHGLPSGCVGHLIKAMRELQRPYAGVERQILAAVKAKNSSVRAHVDLAQLFFSKKMLGSAGR